LSGSLNGIKRVKEESAPSTCSVPKGFNLQHFSFEGKKVHLTDSLRLGGKGRF
jgi:hypothetical protein